jgi:Polyphosphate kinase 2 (PPK2)
MVGKGGILAGLDLSLKLTPKQEAARLAAAQARLLHLRLVLGGQIGDHPQLGPPVCVVFEGWDASGKGGAIKRLVEPLDPRHVRVAQFGAPSYDDKRHHFLWRFWPVLPGWGGMAVLDRSWYGRVLVERVEGSPVRSCLGHLWLAGSGLGPGSGWPKGQAAWRLFQSRQMSRCTGHGSTMDDGLLRPLPPGLALP